MGTIHVILTTPGRIGSHLSRVMSMARPHTEDIGHEPKKAKVGIQLALSFLNDDKVETIQPHDDALVIIFRIRGV